MLGIKMGLETPPAFTAHPSEADGEQVSEAGGPWGHPPICAEQEEASAPPSVPPEPARHWLQCLALQGQRGW